MKLSRIILAALLVLTLIFTMAACSKNKDNNVTDDSNNASESANDSVTEDTTLEEAPVEDTPAVDENGNPIAEPYLVDIMNYMYENCGAEELPSLMQIVITSENVEYYLGTADIDYIAALASEPMMSSIPHSVCLVRMPEGADMEAAAQKIRESVDPRKWCCVWVEDENVIVDYIGDTIVLIMDNELNTGLHDAFKAIRNAQ